MATVKELCYVHRRPAGTLHKHVVLRFSGCDGQAVQAAGAKSTAPKTTTCVTFQLVG